MRYGNFRNTSDKVFTKKRKFIPYPALKDAKSFDVVHNLGHTMFNSVGALGIAHRTIFTFSKHSYQHGELPIH